MLEEEGGISVNVDGRGLDYFYCEVVYHLAIEPKSVVESCEAGAVD